VEPLSHPTLEGPGLPRMVGVSAALHALLLLGVVALDLVRPRPHVYRDVITVDLVAPPQAPEAVVVPAPQPPAAEPPAAEAPTPKPPPPPAPQAPPRDTGVKVLPPLKENPLWAKLDKLNQPKAPPPSEASMSSRWKDVAKAPPPPKTAKAPPPKENLKEWWNDEMTRAAATAPPAPPEVKVPEQKAMLDRWQKINATLPEAARLGEAELQAGASGELAQWWDKQVAMATDAGRRAQAASAAGTPQYLALVERRVSARWSPPDIFRDRREVVVVLAFELGPDGHVDRVRIDRSSGSAYYDQAALRAIFLSDPFPAFPKEVKEPALDIRITLSLDRSRPG